MPKCALSQNYRVYYEDTDAGGVVYHANYLKFCERLRSDFVRDVLGINQGQMLESEKKGFVVTRMSARFMGSAKLDDIITVDLYIKEVRRASIEMYEEIKNSEGKVLFTLLVEIASIDLARHRPCAMSPESAQKMHEYVAGDDLKINV